MTSHNNSQEKLNIQEAIKRQTEIDIKKEIEINGAIYKKNAKIGYSTIDHKGHLKIVSIMNYLQDAASEHASIMGVSGFDLAEKNLGWVISRYHIRIKNHPLWQDTMQIRTFRFPHKNLYEMRNITMGKLIKPTRFKPYDLNHENDKGDYHCIVSDKEKNTDTDTGASNFFSESIHAKVCWVMVNRENGKPVRLSRFIEPQMCEPLSETTFVNLYRDMNDRKYMDKRDNSDENAKIDHYYFSNIEKPVKTDFELPFKVRMHDLDLNGHVNNAIFVEWAVETMPEKILSCYSPEIIDVIFNKESLYGDTVISKTEIYQNRCSSEPNCPSPLTRHVIVRQKDQAELAHINITWCPDKKITDLVKSI
ncbi:Acyl-acyl carrier protein thioesterase [Desulfamplus magnetovallimortis]|uniref:Acyl-acyl carrier protein thioesterase n=1 Tax=Desulfamplus magnetovallimortis TaxID=1246637 RepID=A0A1W1H787_9BACT|nr:acyl-ACP thioesterase domain-containing protein [Desulfamplus magnetovallimortis]SLM28248.1 Acyl-acyl carrier protein thioesterase [Desulfamplus magnetovallimortis]